MNDTTPPRTSCPRLKILISAYACEPGEGSEPGTGFAWVREAAKRHDVWVLTRANNQQQLEEVELPPNVTPLYVDPPRSLTWWKRGQRGIHAFYVLWQRLALTRARQEHARIGFDVIHHATFATYWLPTWMWQVNAPLVWGPVGGGEVMPIGFSRTLSASSLTRERLRTSAVRTAEMLGWPQSASRHAAICLATSDGTADQLRRLGARHVDVFGPPVGISTASALALNQASLTQSRRPRFLCVGRLHAWKGFHIALRAFAEIAHGSDSASLDIVGTGPGERELRRLSAALGVADRVEFLGWLEREHLFRHVGNALALVHPSLHDPGAWIVAEALAAGTPVIAHNAGGPAVLLGQQWPLLVPYVDQMTSVHGVTAHMRRILGDQAWASQLRREAQRRARDWLTWDHQGHRMNEVYMRVRRAPGP